MALVPPQTVPPRSEEFVAAMKPMVDLMADCWYSWMEGGALATWACPTINGGHVQLPAGASLRIMQAVCDALDMWGPLDHPPFGQPNLLIEEPS